MSMWLNPNIDRVMDSFVTNCLLNGKCSTTRGLEDPVSGASYRHARKIDGLNFFSLTYSLITDCNDCAMD